MAILRCKMCGGNLTVEEGMTVCECEYCGSKQTVPNVDDEKKITLFTRANRLRAACEFDKAFGVYESIITEFQEEAEAYWGLVLCKYGIEYVDDPKTGKKIPTCHRSSFDSVMEDPDFEMVMEYSDVTSRAVYREEAKAIEALRVGIIEVSSKEEPYDIFICYKETDENGERTIDSVLAQDVYDALVGKGYKVFFSRITLEDKLGQEYEPYIFAALNSAKIMLAFGTNYEYYNAVWVKNEWSRFLSLIEKGAKKTLIPCYKDIDAYDMPPEFKKLQGQDMGKVGAMQDLLRGIEKICPQKVVNAVSSSSISEGPDVKIAPLLERVDIFLSDGDWVKANEYCEKVLDADPKNAQAYLRKALVEIRAKSLDEVKNITNKSITSSSNYEKTIRFADDGLKHKVEVIAEIQKKSIDEARKEQIYVNACELYGKEKSETDYAKTIRLFEQIPGYKDSDEKLLVCKKSGSGIIYKSACQRLERTNNVKRLSKATELFESISGYLDSSDKAEYCRKQISYLEEKSKNIKAVSREVFKQYQLMISTGNVSEMEKLLSQHENEVTKLVSDLNTLKQKIPSMTDSFTRIEELKKQLNDLGTLGEAVEIKKSEEQIKNITDEIERLSQRRSSLGFFAGKEKKQIDEQVESLRSQETGIKQRLESYNNALQRKQADLNNELALCRKSTDPYANIEAVDIAINQTEGKIANKTNEIDKIKVQIEEARIHQGNRKSEEQIYRELLDKDILIVLMKDHDAAKVLEDDEKVKRFFEKHPNIDESDDYSPMDFEQLNKLERLDTWTIPSYKARGPFDKRSEAELLDDIEAYLKNAELLEEYDVDREVSPEVFDADSVFKDEKYENLYNSIVSYTDENGETYSANKHGRPISFVIKDSSGKIKIMIMVAKESSFSHWLVRWAKLWCDQNNVPFLKLYIGAPNTEHYVVRRVCEKMKLVKTNGYMREKRNPRTGELIKMPI